MVPYQYTDMPGHRKQAGLELRINTMVRALSRSTEGCPGGNEDSTHMMCCMTA